MVVWARPVGGRRLVAPGESVPGAPGNTFVPAAKKLVGTKAFVAPLNTFVLAPLKTLVVTKAFVAPGKRCVRPATLLVIRTFV